MFNKAELTPEQRDHIQQAKAHGDRRVHLEFTADQRAEYRKAVDEELAAKEANIEQYRKIQLAAEQPGFIGDIRRAVRSSRKPITELASRVDIEPVILSSFLAGDVELPAASLDRLVEALGLRLMQEIPR